MEIKRAPEVELQESDDSSSPEESSPTRKISTQQILIIISIAAVNFCAMACYSILGPFFPAEALRKGANQTIVGGVLGCYAICQLITSLVAGRYIVQIGAKMLLILGLCVSAVTTIAFGLLDRAPAGVAFIALSFFVRSVDAVGFGAALTSTYAIITKTFPNNVASIFGLMEISTGLGLVLGPPIGGWLYQSYGYETPFLALGCLVGLIIPLIVCILPKIEADSTNDSFIGLFTSLKVILISFAIFQISSAISFLDTTLSLFAMKMFGMTPGHVGYLMVGFSLPYGLTAPVVGYVTDKFPHWKMYSIMIGNIGTGIAFWFLGPVPFFHITSKLWLTVFMLCLSGLFVGMALVSTLPELISTAIELGYEDGLGTLGMVSGLFSAVWATGMFYGPIAGGAIAQHLNFEWAAAIQGCIGILSGLFLGAHKLYLRSRGVNERTPLLND